MTPMRVLISDATKAVASTLGPAHELLRTYAEATMPEGVNDLPSLMVYAASGETDTRSAGADRSTFQGGVRVANLVVNVDVYVRQRSQMGEDVAQTSEVTDAIMQILEAQNTKPYFGLDGLKGFHWSWARVVFTYGDSAIKYVGVQFVLTFTIF